MVCLSGGSRFGKNTFTLLCVEPNRLLQELVKVFPDTPTGEWRSRNRQNHLAVASTHRSRRITNFSGVPSTIGCVPAHQLCPRSSPGEPCPRGTPIQPCDDSGFVTHAQLRAVCHTSGGLPAASWRSAANSASKSAAIRRGLGRLADRNRIMIRTWCATCSSSKLHIYTVVFNRRRMLAAAFLTPAKHEKPSLARCG